MNENIDLTKILDGCPKGTKFYSSDFGEVTLSEVSPYDWDHYPIKLHYRGEVSSRPLVTSLTKKGQNVYGYDGECTLFPSKTQRDWSKFERFRDKPKVERFDPKTFEPFDKVLVRNRKTEIWLTDMFTFHIDEPVAKCITGAYMQCIPYNDNTKHLLGTTDDCPEYYKWWEK